MRFETKTMATNSGEYAFGDIALTISERAWDLRDDFGHINLAEAKVHLTVKDALDLIKVLQTAIELDGLAYIVHDSGTISIDTDYHYTNYDSLDEYKSSLVSAE